MSNPVVNFNPAQKIEMYFRIRRAGTKTFTFVDSNGSPVDISGYQFAFYLKDYQGAIENKIALTVGSGLTISGSNNILSVALTVSNTALNESEYYCELFKGSTSKTYLSGQAFGHNGKYDGKDSDSSSIVIDDNGTPITVVINDTLSGEVPVVDFTTVLTFDYDKDLATVSGGTRTFTLSATGNLNGVGIVARINDPVAINFPVSFEAASGGDSVSTTDMNIVVFRYFKNYDGLGTDKVLYMIKNQTSI